VTRKDLVGPLPTILFQYGERAVRIAYEVPRDTMDPRYALCTEHHPACDCREAELAEQLGEYRAEQTAARRAAARLLAGHRLKDWQDDDKRSRAEIGDELWWRYAHGDGPLACQCTGCKLARASDLRVRTDENGIVLADAERKGDPR
jgi:hypothetical protein